jgi:hypothetical protein
VISARSSLGRFGLMICAFLFLGGCGNSGKTYVLTGRVISKQPAANQLIINNDDIPGFMPAMTMHYVVKDADGFERVQPEDIIRADVVMEQPNQFHLEHLAVIGRSGAGSSPSGAARHVLMIGDKAPRCPTCESRWQNAPLEPTQGEGCPPDIRLHSLSFSRLLPIA